MVDPVALDGVAEGADHVLLTDDLVEGLRAMAAVERGLGAHRAESSGGPAGLRRERGGVTVQIAGSA